MEDVVRKRIVGAVVLVVIGVTLPFLLSRCMHGPSPDGQAMRVYEVTPSGGVEAVDRSAADHAAQQRDAQASEEAAADAATTAMIATQNASTDDDAQSSPPARADAQTASDAVESAGGTKADNDASGLRKTVAAGSWVVQVASFSSETDARALAQRLKGAYDVFYTPAQVNGDTWFRVRIGPFDTDAAAKNAAAELRAQGRDTLVVHVD